MSVVKYLSYSISEQQQPPKAWLPFPGEGQRDLSRRRVVTQRQEQARLAVVFAGKSGTANETRAAGADVTRGIR